MIKVWLDIPAEYAARAKFALGELAVRWSIPVALARAPDEAQLVYSRATGQQGAVTVPFDHRVYEPGTPCRLTRRAGRPVWAPVGVEGERADLIGGVFRLLTLLDETQVKPQDRDRRGTFPVTALPPERAAAVDVPLVESHADILRDESASAGVMPEQRVARWQGGAQAALVMTLDADAVHLGAVAEVSANLAKLLARRRLEYWIQFREGLRWLGRFPSNPYFAFADWAEWLGERGIAPTFFLFVQPKGVPRVWNDCRTSVDNQPVDWETLRALAVDGVEFGLHPSIQTKENTRSFLSAKEWLEGKLNRPVKGLRHHYFALDWENPYRTFRRHVQAGFVYDSSLAWRDRGGFRAGTCLPFCPYDLENDRVLDLVEIPCILMDSYLGGAGYGGNGVQGERDWRAVVQAAVEAGGAVVLNWHQENFWNRGTAAGRKEALDQVLRFIRQSGEVWAATGAEIAGRWRALRRQLVLFE